MKAQSGDAQAQSGRAWQLVRARLVAFSWNRCVVHCGCPAGLRLLLAINARAHRSSRSAIPSHHSHPTRASGIARKNWRKQLFHPQMAVLMSKNFSSPGHATLEWHHPWLSPGPCPGNFVVNTRLPETIRVARLASVHPSRIQPICDFRCAFVAPSRRPVAGDHDSLGQLCDAGHTILQIDFGRCWRASCVQCAVA